MTGGGRRWDSSFDARPGVDPGTLPYTATAADPPDPAAVCCPRCRRPVAVVARRSRLVGRVPALVCGFCLIRRGDRPDWLCSEEPADRVDAWWDGRDDD